MEISYWRDGRLGALSTPLRVASFSNKFNTRFTTRGEFQLHWDFYRLVLLIEKNKNHFETNVVLVFYFFIGICKSVLLIEIN